MSETRPPFALRAASPRDAATLTALRAALFTEIGRAAAAHEQAAFERLSTLSFTEELERATCRAWLAESPTHQPIGSVALLTLPRLPTPDSHARAEGYLVNVYTLLEWRRRGVARALVAAAVAKARELGLGRIRLHATPAGQAVYAAAGFRLRSDEMELRL